MKTRRGEFKAMVPDGDSLGVMKDKQPFMAVEDVERGKGEQVVEFDATFMERNIV